MFPRRLHNDLFLKTLLAYSVRNTILQLNSNTSIAIPHNYYITFTFMFLLIIPRSCYPSFLFSQKEQEQYNSNFSQSRITSRKALPSSPIKGHKSKSTTIFATLELIFLFFHSNKINLKKLDINHLLVL